MLHELINNSCHRQVLREIIMTGGDPISPSPLTLVPTTKFLTPSIHFEPEFIQLDIVETTELEIM